MRGGHGLGSTVQPQIGMSSLKSGTERGTGRERGAAWDGVLEPSRTFGGWERAGCRVAEGINEGVCVKWGRGDDVACPPQARHNMRSTSTTPALIFHLGHCVRLQEVHIFDAMCSEAAASRTSVEYKCHPGLLRFTGEGLLGTCHGRRA